MFDDKIEQVQETLITAGESPLSVLLPQALGHIALGVSFLLLKPAALLTKYAERALSGQNPFISPTGDASEAASMEGILLFAVPLTTYVCTVALGYYLLPIIMKVRGARFLPKHGVIYTVAGMLTALIIGFFGMQFFLIVVRGDEAITTSVSFIGIVAFVVLAVSVAFLTMITALFFRMRVVRSLSELPQ